MHPPKPTRWASGLLPLSRTLEVYKTAKHYVVAESRALMTLYVGDFCISPLMRRTA